MPPIEERAFSSAVTAYEAGRRVLAVNSAVVAATLPVLALACGARPVHCLLLGGALLSSVVVAQLVGRGFSRALAPGVLGGLPALVGSLGALSHGHVTLGDACFSLCMPTCAIGGVVAGVVASRVSRANGGSLTALATSAGFSLLVGAMGCACVGYAGVVALAVALAATSLGARFLVPARTA